MIYFVIGPSASGKDYFFKYIADKYDLNRIIQHTTRPIRDGEVEGVNYYFVTMDKMNEMDQNHELIERRFYNACFGLCSYGTHKNSVDLNKNYVTINTWDGYRKFLEALGQEHVFPIYFELDPGIRLERALAREKTQKEPRYDELCRRFLADSKDFSKELKEKYQPYIIDNNGTIEETQKQIDKLLLARKIGVR